MIVITAATAYPYSGDNLFCTVCQLSWLANDVILRKTEKYVIYQAIFNYGLLI